jgi:hypothetical protein
VATGFDVVFRCRIEWKKRDTQIKSKKEQQGESEKKTERTGTSNQTFPARKVCRGKTRFRRSREMKDWDEKTGRAPRKFPNRIFNPPRLSNQSKKKTSAKQTPIKNQFFNG